MQSPGLSAEPAPIDLDRVLSPEWLGAALARDGAPAAVESVRVVDIFGPSATKARVELEFGPSSTGLHQAYCIKGFFGGDALGYLKSGVQVTEASFYRECAAHLPIRVPDCAYAGVDPATNAGLIVMKDLITAGARFLTALEPYTVEQARGSLDQLARLHATSSTSETLARWPWVRSRIEELTQYQHVPAARVTELMAAERGEGLPEAVRDGDRIYAALAALGRRSASSPACLIHGDAHAGNVFETAAGIGLVDWQLLQRGHWSLDVAYHVAAVLTVEDRRASEEELLRHYLDRYAAYRGAAPDWSEAWARYREALAYGLFLWSITVRVDPPIIRQFIIRLGTAVADHRSMDLLGA